MSGRWLWLFVPGAVAYLCLDGHPESWLNGLPWRSPSLMVATLGGIVLWALWPPRRLPSPPGVPSPPTPLSLTRERGNPGGTCASSRTKGLLKDCVGLPSPAKRGRGWGRGLSLAPALAVAVCALALAKGAVGWAALPAGLPGWYYDNSRFQGEFEKSTDFRGEPWTRREREIFFGGDEFPAYFLNDVLRFNFFGAEADRRRNLPFSVRWEGVLYIPSDGAYQLWLTASGPADLRLDDKQLTKVDSDGRETATVTQQLTAGSHPIRITYARRPPRSPDLKLEWQLDGKRQPVGVPYLFPSEVRPAQWTADRTLLTLSRGLDALFLVLASGTLVWLGVMAALRAVREPAARWQLGERVLLGVWLMAVFVSATVPRLDRVDKLALLGGGQDWLTHETFARDIIINGPLMTLGKPLGEGRTFYAQPFYPYALAALHALAGEDQFGVTALQVLASGVAGVLLYSLARRLFGTPAAIGTFLLFLPLWKWHLEWVSYRLLSEVVYFVVLPALLLLLVRCLDERRRSDFLLAGLLLGLAIVTRGPTLLYVPFLGLILWLGLRQGTALTPQPPLPAAGEGESQGGSELPARAALVRLALLGAVAGLIVILVPIRNSIVAGEPALVASSGGVNLQKLHRPTNQVRLNQAQDRWFAPYLHDAPTRETVEFLLQDPVGYAYATLLLAEYTLGYGAAVEESQVTVWPELIAFNVMYLLAIVWLAGARSPRAGLLHAFVFIHFLTMIFFVPYDYDNRLVLPMYLPIIAFGGYLLSEAVLRAFERVRRPAPARTALAEPPAS